MSSTPARQVDAGASADPEHYLKTELYELVRTDPAIFDFLQAGSLDGIWYWDVERPAEEWMSPRMKELFGYADHEVPNTSAWWQKHIFPEDLQVALDNFQKHCESPSHPYDQIVRYRHRDGSTVWVRCRGVAIRDETGKPLRLLGAHTDVTALKQAEQQLADRTAELERRTAQLKRSNEELQQFAYVASHDLQEPLRMVSGYVSLLAERYRGKLDADADEFIGFATDGAERMKALIDGLLALSRIETGNVEMNRVVTVEALHHALMTLREEVKERQAEVTWDTLPNVAGSEALVTQLFANLVGNALKFTRDQPRIHIAAAEQTPGWIRFSVRDNGIGIDRTQAADIFRIFKRLHGRDDYRGHGIGLAICRRIVECHGGGIWYESEPGEGTTFHFSLPAYGKKGDT